MPESSALSESPVLPLLFAQLQARYPTSGLLTELVQMEVDRCVVRASVQFGNSTLATSMATAATVEQAEDQARLRVLALLGINAAPSNIPAVALSYGTPAPPTQTAQDGTQLVDLLADAAFQNIPPTAMPDGAAIATPLPFPAVSFEPITLFEPNTTTFPVAAVEPYNTELTVTEQEPELFDASDHDDAPYDNALYEAEPFEAPEPLVMEEPISEEAVSRDRVDAEAFASTEAVAKSKPRKPSVDKERPVSEVTSSSSTSGTSRDLSSLISQIGVEIDRIGWSKRQGSTYLQKTYGKKTRSELTDDELEDFLAYLSTQLSNVE